eukprot:CAMPEP_0185210016 /NCGR_PEP_ID=MMETSP1140-20130426/64817_1 /TAXON_ID=298111 /ORGANISM="Pavlova sp., Strain CCMP459" /LENGTH=47 /DNA_ID= /DNA_START= /DNA_END= /DNA_ORIENTATION=
MAARSTRARPAVVDDVVIRRGGPVQDRDRAGPIPTDGGARLILGPSS